MNLDENDIIKEIVAKTGKTADEIAKLIEDKELEFSGMVSRTGAAFIVGRELGVNLVKPAANVLKIKNIVPELSRVNFFGKIIQVSQVREFETERGKGKVVNLVLADDTGTIRIPLWNESSDLVGGESGFAVGDIVEISGAYTRKDTYGRAELQLGKYGTIKKNSEVSIDVTSDVPTQSEAYKDMTLDNITENTFVNIRATIIQVFERKMIYRKCSMCKEKLEGMLCGKHKDAKPDRLLMISAMLDDGYASINAAFFREAAENLLQKSTNEIEEDIMINGERAIWNNLKVVGKTYNIQALVRKNDVMNRLELAVHKIKAVNVSSECAALLTELKAAGVSVQ